MTTKLKRRRRMNAAGLQGASTQHPAMATASGWPLGGWIAFALMVVLVGGLYMFTLTTARDEPLVYDEAIYLQIAQRIAITRCPIIATGDGIVFADNPPLVMYVSALMRRLGGESLMWLRSAHVTLWVLPGYIATSLLALRMFGVAAGVLAVVGFYTQHRFISEAAEVRIDVPLASLSALFLLVLIELRRAKTRRARRCLAVACGLLACLASLTRYQGVLLPFTGVVYLLLASCFPGDKGAPRQLLLFEVGVITLGALAAGALWGLVNTACGGDLMQAVLGNLRRVNSETSEPWFHRPLLTYWQDLATCVGPVFVGGVMVSLLLWLRRLKRSPEVALVSAWVILTFVFCSAIGLRHERYFLPAIPAMAVLVGSLAAPETYEALAILKVWARAAPALRLVLTLVVLVSSAVLFGQSIANLAQLQRTGQRSNSFYIQLGGAVRATTSPQEDRLLISRAQTAYFAERNYFLSEYEPDASRLIDMLANPANRITIIVEDSNQFFHPEMSAAGRTQFWEYVGRHFARLRTPGVRAALYRRTSWSAG